MNMFDTRQSNILCLYIISLSVCTSPPFTCAVLLLCLFNGRGPDTLQASGAASNPAGLLMTSSLITSPLLLTPALKNNIYPVCHHHHGGCVCLCVCGFLPLS